MEEAPPEAVPPSGRLRSASLAGLFVLACLYTLAAAKEFLLPLAVGIMVFFLLRPAVQALARIRVPEPVGAAIVLLGLVATVGLALYALSWPASTWMARAPQSLRRIETRLRPLAQRFQRVTRTAAEVEKITEVGGTAAPTPEVQIKEPSLGAMLVGGMQSFLGGALIVLSLVYFLLASGQTFPGKIVRLLPRGQDRAQAAEIVREMEKQISQYLLLTSVINVVFGVAVGLALWALGMPNPLLWGAVAAVTNFIPYLGGVLATVVLGLAAVLTYDSLWQALLVPAVFFALNTLEGFVITPYLVGRRFTLDPAFLFIGLLFWWYVWGIAGALLAVPMMVAFKIVCERVDSLKGVAELMGGES